MSHTPKSTPGAMSQKLHWTKVSANLSSCILFMTPTGHSRPFNSMLKYAYYHNRINSALRFITQPGKRILLYGFHDGQLLHELSPKPGYGIDPHPQICKISKREFPDQTIICTSFAKYRPTTTFDYVILNGALGKTDDIMRL